MSAVEALKAARAAGLRLDLDGGDIVVEAPSRPPRAVLDLLVRYKATIIRDGLLIRDGEMLLQERAAIIEHDGGAPREWAEALARLDPASPLGDVPPKRWVQFIDDCGHFIDNGWAHRAAELGWTPFDLFGCDRSRPYARVGRCGLLWLLEGRTLRVLTADTAVINTVSGSSLTFYRRPHEPGQVLPWELALTSPNFGIVSWSEKRRTKMTKEYLSWVASRKQAGEDIDVETCEIGCWWADYEYPYGTRPENDERMNVMYTTKSITLCAARTAMVGSARVIYRCLR